MTREIDIGGNQGRGNPEISPAPRCCESNRLEADTLILDPDSGWQDSAQAMLYDGEEADQPGDNTSPWGIWSAALAWAVVALCAATVIVACEWVPA
jgi:hypothetical protein